MDSLIFRVSIPTYNKGFESHFVVVCPGSNPWHGSQVPGLLSKLWVPGLTYEMGPGSRVSSPTFSVPDLRSQVPPKRWVPALGSLQKSCVSGPTFRIYLLNPCFSQKINRMKFWKLIFDTLGGLLWSSQKLFNFSRYLWTVTFELNPSIEQWIRVKRSIFNSVGREISKTPLRIS